MSAQPSDFVEKRQHRRYKVNPGSFAVFRQDNAVMPGLIIDISMGGLAFIYFEGENWPQDPDELYYLFGDEFNVENVPMETVFDTELKDESNPFYQLLLRQKPEGKRVRRRGVKFRELTSLQKKDLEGLIQEFHKSLEQQKSSPNKNK